MPLLFCASLIKSSKMVKSSKNSLFGQSGSSSSSPSGSGSSSVHGQMNCPSSSGSSLVYGQINNSSSSTSSLNSPGGYFASNQNPQQPCQQTQVGPLHVTFSSSDQPAFGFWFGTRGSSCESVSIGSSASVSSRSPFGSRNEKSILGNSGSQFGVLGTISFGLSNSTTSGFGQISSFGSVHVNPASSNRGHGYSSAPAFGASGTRNVGPSNTRSCGPSQKPSFGQSVSSFGGSNLPGKTPFGTQNSHSGTNDSRLATQAGGQVINELQTASLAAEVVQSTGSNSFRSQHELQILVDDPGCTLSVQLGNPGIHVKVFCNEEKVATFKVDNALISKENPGPQVFNSTKDSPWNDKPKESSRQQGTSNNMNESDQTSNDEVVENRSVGSNLNTNGVIYNDNPIPARCFHIIVKEDEDGEVADSEEGEVADNVGQNPNIAAIMPKIHSADCYTKPPIKELAARERAEPGFCACVKDFVFGRQGYGSIKFLGETDVRELDLESLIQFNHGVVIVYMDESKKPPIGQGLNRPAEITLFNVRCIDKNCRKAYIDGPKVEKYKEILRQKAAELGAEMVSYDPQQGEWKFKFQHF